MAQFAIVPLIELALPNVISTFSRYGPGIEFTNHAPIAQGDASWALANQAQLYEITIPVSFTVRFFRWATGTVVVGNYDIGIYDLNFSLLRSLGSTPHPGADIIVENSITPLNLQSGNYWLAFVADNNSFSIISKQAQEPHALATSPIRAALAAFPLPATITPTAIPSARLQAIAIANQAI